MSLYRIEEHMHIAAAWGAATGARASKLCRFRVEIGRGILESAGFTSEFSLGCLPEPSELDEWHQQKRELIVQIADQRGVRNFTHGIAAKLINGYLKDRFVCGGCHEDRRVIALHPPIDALLLEALAEANFGGQAASWLKFRDKRWSRFDSDTYQAVIDLMRESLPEGEPFWTIERYWRGHQ